MCEDEELFRKYCPDFCAGGECLEPYFSVFQAGMDVMQKRLDQLQGYLDHDIEYDIEQRNMELQEKIALLEELLAEQYPDLKQSLEWADQRENELVEENRRLQEQIERMTADVCGNIRWAYMNKNDQMYCKLNAMLNQWEAEDDRIRS